MTIECSIGIIKESDKYLFSQRSKKPFLDHFEFPGGKLESNESSDQAIDREIFEELGVKIVDKIYFRDHKQYDDRAIEKIEKLLKQNNQRVFYTTQKDWIKLPPAFLKKYHGVYVEMDVFVDDLEFQNLLLKKIE